MYSTTLRGVFPEPKPVYRRNFIKENVKSIKQMQGILQEAGVIQSRRRPVLERYKNAPRLSKSESSTTSKSGSNLAKISCKVATNSDNKVTSKIPNVPGTTTLSTKTQKSKAAFRKKDNPLINSQGPEVESRVTHRAMQTEREEDLRNLYDSGVIKYPSPGVLSHKKAEKPGVKPQQNGEGDHVDNITQEVENLNVDDKDFIKENKQNIKPRPTKQSPVKVMAQAPPNYQRGVLPKYLRDKREDTCEEPDTECPPGHILLPEEERKETLRVLRQSYADRIQELNMMPVRNDTLKMKKRKMEIEEELKRIDGGIKVFQRPKVFVKINA